MLFLVYFRTSSMKIQDLLTNPKERLNATAEELNYIDLLLKTQWRKQIFSYGGYDSLSTIIDGFLYQSNKNDATNIKLLKQYNVRHIISLCNSIAEHLKRRNPLKEPNLPQTHGHSREGPARRHESPGTYA